MVPGWTKVLFFKSRVVCGGGLIIASQNKIGSSVGYNYVGLVNYKHIDSGCHLGSWDQVWVALGGGGIRMKVVLIRGYGGAPS